jgi:hypothetical protein
MPHDHNIRVITSGELRDNFPAIRAGLKKDTQYVLLYRGRPIAEIGPVSTETKELFSLGAPPPLKLPHTTAGRRIKRNTAKRKQKRMKG